MSEAARQHGLSTRQLQRRFNRYLGVGSKWVLQRYRLHEAPSGSPPAVAATGHESPLSSAMPTRRT